MFGLLDDPRDLFEGNRKDVYSSSLLGDSWSLENLSEAPWRGVFFQPTAAVHRVSCGGDQMSRTVISTQKIAYSLEEASQTLGLSINHVRGLLQSGALRGRKSGSRWVISHRALEEFLGDEKKTPSGVESR